MNIADIERFVGLPYEVDTLDCADLAMLVQAELFGKHIAMPGRRQRQAAGEATINRYSGELAMPIDKADLRDGDVVVMHGEPKHIGTVFLLSGVAWVLHTTCELGHSLLQRLSDLPAYGLRIEGFYRWN
ncbi:MAG: hypothetical protein ACRYGK_12970 [Janthinobacterium lividum]